MCRGCPELLQLMVLHFSGGRYFCEIFFGNSLTEKSAKIMRPFMRLVVPIRSRHLVSKRRLSRTKNLNFLAVSTIFRDFSGSPLGSVTN